ncbi:hypothetical protein B0H19DRAFT_1253038 [Mycena capillaripes]|nr:hypothetical protein B0H19DRAFT_1253038 [Mycena capillaripes]
MDWSRVTLACSPAQEAAFYLAPDRDLIDRPYDIFLQLTATDRLPMHLIVCFNDEYKGKTAEMKLAQIDCIRSTARRSVQIIAGGHMFPQTEPLLCAQAILHVLKTLQPVSARL